MKSTRMPIISAIILAEEVQNREKHHAANESYYPCYIQTSIGETSPALFTKHEIETAIVRASKNPEDLGPEAEEKFNWLSLIFG